MIPRTVQLKNFLSYGPEPQTIDFTPYNLICLSGKNGHGKSALLDAITWAIWGQARKTSGNSKADQGLLHLGQKHMFVILEFEVSGQLYRIRREFVQTNSKPFASLDFGIMQSDQKIAALTDKTIKATQEKIEKTIGITYESFINSAFLRQGQSNEFSKKSPKERKEILAEILQLQQFEEQKKIALLHAKKLQQEHKTLCSIQLRIETELEQLTNIDQIYQTILKNLNDFDQQKKDLFAQKQNIEESKNRIFQQLNELEFINKQRLEIEQQLALNKKSIHDISQAWQDAEKIQSTFFKKDLETEQKSLQQLLATMQEKLQKKLAFKETYLSTRDEFAKYTAQLEKKYDEQIHTTQRDLTKHQEQLFTTQQRLKQEQSLATKNHQESVSAQTELLQILHELEQNSFNLQLYQKEEQQLETVTFRYQTLQAQERTLQELLNNRQQQCKIIETKQPCCPLCTQTLSDTAQHQVQTKLIAECTEINNTITDLKAQITVAQNDHKASQLSLQKTKQKYEQSLHLVIQHQELSKTIIKLTDQKHEIEKNINIFTNKESEITALITTIQNQINRIEQEKSNIAQTEQYKQYQTTLSNIEHAAKELGHNPESHKKAELDLQEITKQLIMCESTALESEKQAERKAMLTSLTKITESQTDQLATILNQINNYKNISIEQKKLVSLEQELSRLQTLFDQKQSQLFMEKGSIEQKLRKQKDLDNELSQITKNIKVLYQEMIDYQEIAKALGKDGIQALLIEQAIPEIEDETNEILSRLTNNQTQIFIESLRDLKKGGSRETLDIKISDSFGLRDYEMFSGGEAFRIDFALRIGISKLLARRAGTTLQTIFIDEGFGSQDEEGLQMIMDNLYKIQHDFAKIIIVSHLSEMKEQFPVQFIVEKKRLGSTVSIVEQG